MVIRNAGIWRFDQFNRQFRWTLTKQARVTQADLWNVSSFISDEKIALNLALLRILKNQPKFFK